jgi:hypothetical protein
MTRSNLIPGIGGIAFGILLFVALVIAGPPGGEYSAEDVANYLDDDRRARVAISLYLGIAAVAGLVALLSGLRDSMAAGREQWTRIFWGCGIAAAAAFAIGLALLVTPPLSLAIGGGEAAEPETTYLVTQAGWLVALGAGGLLLGAALVVLMLESGGVLPAWVRWFTLVAGVLGLASTAYFPFFFLLIWGVVIGVWLLTTGRAPAPVPR